MYDSQTNDFLTILKKAQNKLNNAQITNAKKEIDWFLEYIFDIPFYDIRNNEKFQIKDTHLKQLKEFIDRRVLGEPFQYIINRSTFYGYDFIVNKHTLIPRPESETIIDTVKKYGFFQDALDIGTGSGNLAITLSLEKVINKIDAIDISSEALKIATKNTQQLKTNNVTFFHQNIFNVLPVKSYDLIVSNPPYISKIEYRNLNKQVKKYEPQTSLTDNKDGLYFYNFFAKNLFKILKPQGKLILEIGLEKHKETIQKIFINNNYKYKWHKDLNGNYRVIELYQ